MLFSIILIGPIGAGKSTQGELLSAKLNVPYRNMDELRWDYYREIGYSEELEKKISDTEGFLGVYRYWKPFEAHAVERLLKDFPDGVLDFGGGHSVYEDEALFVRVQKAMNSFGNVVLLLPSPDLDESVRILRAGKWTESRMISMFMNISSNIIRITTSPKSLSTPKASLRKRRAMKFYPESETQVDMRYASRLQVGENSGFSRGGAQIKLKSGG